MDDPVFLKQNVAYRERGTQLEELVPNLLGIYLWQPSTVPKKEFGAVVQTTLSDAGFVLVNNAIFKSVPTVSKGSNSCNWISEETGGFTRANSVNKVIQETHDAVDKWTEWDPVTPQQKRFKQIVDSIEMRATRENDDHTFSNLN